MFRKFLVLLVLAVCPAERVVDSADNYPDVRRKLLVCDLLRSQVGSRKERVFGETLRQAEDQFRNGGSCVLLCISQCGAGGTRTGVRSIIRCDYKTEIPLFTEVIYDVTFYLAIHILGRETQL